MDPLDLENEKKEIINRYRALLRACNEKTTKEDKKEIRKAFNLAVKGHENTRRKSGEPYILHPIAVANICAKEIGLGTTSIICALLHDVVEDTDCTLKDIEKLFKIKIEYLENRNIKNLKISNKHRGSKIFLSYYFKGVRLIDNF